MLAGLRDEAEQRANHYHRWQTETQRVEVFLQRRGRETELGAPEPGARDRAGFDGQRRKTCIQGDFRPVRNFSTYLPSRSASTLTASPTLRSRRAVTSCV